VSFPRMPWVASLLLLGSAALIASQLRSQEPALLHPERSFTVHLDAAPGLVFPLQGENKSIAERTRCQYRAFCHRKSPA
jgi:hypothetical protein